MPSANGVYSLPVGYLAVTGAVIQASQHNPPLEDIAAALTARLSRDGTAAMTGALQLAAGIVTTPSLTFSTNNNKGFFSTTNGIGVAVGGVQVAEFLAGGINGARFIGELIPYTCTAAPALTVLPYGQTLSRTTYATLWAQAQIEIAAGNTFYNNGDGSTTFGIGDMRGRLPIGWDKMGGVAANRLTTAGSSVDGSTLGSVGGGQTQTLTIAQLPVITPTTASVGNIQMPIQGGIFSGGGSGSGSATSSVAQGNNQGSSTNLNVTPPAITMNSFGSGAAHPIIPPVLVSNYLLFAGA